MKFDALIIGGGPGGSVAAMALARAGWSVAIVEKSRFPRQKVCGEFISATNLAMLRSLGLAEQISALAGPAVTSINLFAGETILTSPMPRLQTDVSACGRALGRDQLDSILLRGAAKAGAAVFQPCLAAELIRRQDGLVCRIVDRETQQPGEIHAGVGIAAHGSWESGPLPTQVSRRPAKASDLFGFKARFLGSRLPAGAMPLLVFPGGYGGMVHTDGECTSLSCCVRRDRLDRLRRNKPSASAGEMLLDHLRRSCRGVREALDAAKLEAQILSVGPIRPGIRRPYRAGVFCVGNAAGEAHPIVAEGISMAMQSGWLLAETLLKHRKKTFSAAELDAVGSDYSRLWAMNFSPRIRAAGCFANLAMRPATASLLLPLLKLFPQMLTLGARWSGKANPLVLSGAPMKMAVDIST